MRYIILILIFLSCTTPQSLPYTMQVKIIAHNFLPLISGTINGQKVFFILDCGSSVSIIDRTISEKAGVVLGSPYAGHITGYGGNSSGLYEISADIRLGNTQMLGQFLAKDIGGIISAIEASTGYRVSGIIGYNNIKGSRMLLDFKKGFVYK